MPRGERDLAGVARGGAANLLGAVVSAGANFAIALVIARAVAPPVAGRFFTVTSLFLILETLGRLGADLGLVYFIARWRELGQREREIHRRPLRAQHREHRGDLERRVAVDHARPADHRARQLRLLSAAHLRRAPGLPLRRIAQLSPRPATRRTSPAGSRHRRLSPGAEPPRARRRNSSRCACA